MTFYDSHLHCCGGEAGGFLIGLEGERMPGTLGNSELAAVVERKPNCLPFHYVTASEVMGGQPVKAKYLKYHPRREGYSPDAVGRSIAALKPRAVIFDTLNEPFWSPFDYWHLCKEFASVSFLMAHAGGYSAHEFVKMCHIQRNVWIDFSLTHTCFASISGNPLPGMDELIKYALRAPFAHRVLMGSDFPYSRQDEVVEYYDSLGVVEQLNSNFQSLLAAIG